MSIGGSTTANVLSGDWCELFVARVFRGGGDADTEGLDLGIGLVLTLLAMPGGFVSLLLVGQVRDIRCNGCGESPTSILCKSALPDEYFFIVLSMTVTGAVAVWRWDAIFPDRRDYMNLVPLPISTQDHLLGQSCRCAVSGFGWSLSTSTPLRAFCFPRWWLRPKANSCSL